MDAGADSGDRSWTHLDQAGHYEVETLDISFHIHDAAKGSVGATRRVPCVTASTPIIDRKRRALSCPSAERRS